MLHITKSLMMMYQFCHQLLQSCTDFAIVLAICSLNWDFYFQLVMR